MKKLLIFTNLILFCLAVVLILSNMVKSKQNQLAEIEKQQVNTSPRKSSAEKSRKNSVDAGGERVSLPTPDNACGMIISNDVFSQVRAPLANTRMGRADMILVGVIEGKAAIIRSNTRQQQFNPYLVQAQMMTSHMNGRGFHQWSQMSGRRNNGPAQQYVKIEQMMNNGFTLKEVQRDRAILVRGNDRVELVLQVPSKNRAAARAPRQLSQAQQFQQAQMYMQSQMIRSIREIQQNNRSNQQGSRNRR